MPRGTSLSLAPWLHARSPGSACSGVIRNEPLDPPVSDPRRQCHRRSLHPAGRYPKDLLAWLSGERKALRADASMATPANAPPPRVSDVSWTSLAMVRDAVYAGLGGRKFWGAVSPISDGQVVDGMGVLEKLCSRFDPPLSYTSGVIPAGPRKRAALSGTHFSPCRSR